MAPRIARGLLMSLIVGVAAGLASAALDGKVEPGWVVLGVLIVAGLVLGRVQLRRLRVTYAVTNRRVTVETGLIARRRRVTDLSEVGAVRSRQTFVERALGVGSVDFETYGGRVRVRGVEQPRRLAADIDAVIAERYRI